MPLGPIIAYTDLEPIERLTFSAADQTRVGTLITQLEAWLKKHMFDWTYAAAGSSKTILGSGTRYLNLGYWCQAVTAITVDGDALDADQLADVINGKYYLYRRDGQVWPEDVDVVITGTWGWNTSADIPADFKLLACLAFRELWDRFGSQPLTSMSAGDYSEAYVTPVIGANSVLNALMDAYRLPAVY